MLRNDTDNESLGECRIVLYLARKGDHPFCFLHLPLSLVRIRMCANYYSEICKMTERENALLRKHFTHEPKKPN